MGRLLIVSNRLPVRVVPGSGGVELVESEGGLATGLFGPHRESGGLWFGWPGQAGKWSDAQRHDLSERLAEHRLVPVDLSPGEVSGFYEGFANGVLWPLFHYLIDRVPFDNPHWDSYVAVNRKYAELVAREASPKDLIWIHDYQLMLVPGFLRSLLPRARIGYFLHIPFPSSEVFRVLPQRDAILRGVLGADLIGFHTFSYMRNFAASLLDILGVEADVDQVQVGDREIRLGVFPISVDAASFSALAKEPDVLDEVAQIRAEAPGQRILLGIDRLDYTKGIPRRLLAVERLLEREPRWRGQLRFLQVAVPSREKVTSYREYRRVVNELVGRINGSFGSVGSVPVHYLYRSFSKRQLAALYRAADVMLVTPLRDGMNLVAKEFVASRPDEDGVLVLSELAGAASELGDALLVNPYDLERVAQSLDRALTMPLDERRLRMGSMRAHVLEHDVQRWADRFLQVLGRPPVPAARSTADVGEALARIRSADRLVLLLDYDGTLVPFAPLPELATPPPELLRLLERLTRRPGTTVHIVSGRPSHVLETWFGGLALGLHAEHGLWSRDREGEPWHAARAVGTDWKERVRPLLEQFVERTPGSFVEEKSASLAWHYRRSGPALGVEQARRLRLHLCDLLRTLPVEVLPGERVVEVRHRDVHKGLVSWRIVDTMGAGAVVAAFGDDRTDEDMFEALPPGSLAVRVGAGPTRAPLRLSSFEEVRRLLEGILESGSAGPSGRRAAAPSGDAIGEVHESRLPL